MVIFDLVKIMNKKIVLSLIIIVWVIITVGAYLSVFHNGLSTQAADWGNFGSYLSGVITVPFSVISAYFLYQTYQSTERTYKQSIKDSQIAFAHAAIKEASESLDAALNDTFTVNDQTITFKELHTNPRLARQFLPAVKHHDDFNAHYRSGVGKSFICLYDFLWRTETDFGMTEFVRFYKIKYQWMIRIHNVYEVGVIELSGSKSSKDIEDYFYDVGDLIKNKAESY